MLLLGFFLKPVLHAQTLGDVHCAFMHPGVQTGIQFLGSLWCFVYPLSHEQTLGAVHLPWRHCGLHTGVHTEFIV